MRVEPLPTEKSAQKFLGLPFCCTVGHVQLKNVTVDVMNMIVTITVGVKCAQNASKCTILNEKILFFSGAQTPSPDPIQNPSLSASSAPPFECLRHSNPPNQISGYGPELG